MFILIFIFIWRELHLIFFIESLCAKLCFRRRCPSLPSIYNVFHVSLKKKNLYWCWRMSQLRFLRTKTWIWSPEPMCRAVVYTFLVNLRKREAGGSLRLVGWPICSNLWASGQWEIDHVSKKVDDTWNCPPDALWTANTHNLTHVH